MQRYFSIWIFLIAFYGNAQNQYQLKLHFSGKDAIKLNQQFGTNRTYTDSIERNNVIQTILRNLNKESYLLATCNQIVSDSINSEAYIVEGQKFKGILIRKGNTNPEIFSEAGFKEYDVKANPLTVNEYYQYSERILKIYEEQGFPFAAVKLDSIQFDSLIVNATLHIYQGRFISFDTLHVVGNSNIKKW